MIIGESIATETTTFSPWFERQGDAGTFFIQIMQRMPDCDVVGTVQTKNKEDADSAATSAGSFGTLSTTGTHSVRATSLKELVRIRMVVADGSEGESWVHLRVMPPSWETN